MRVPPRSLPAGGAIVLVALTKLYPGIALGAKADPDTIDYAVGSLVDEIGAIATSPPDAARERLERDGRVAVAAWRSLAIRRIGTVSFVERRQAARTAARVDQLVLLGATTCRALRPNPA